MTPFAENYIVGKIFTANIDQLKKLRDEKEIKIAT